MQWPCCLGLVDREKPGDIISASVLHTL